MPITKVKDVMLPLERYTNVSEDAALQDVFLALEGALKGRGKTDPAEARDFAVLVLDKNKQVLGRLGVWDVLHGLDPQLQKRVDPLAMVDGYEAWDQPLAHLASKARHRRARDLVNALPRHEFIDEEASINEALRRLLDNRTLSLIAMRGTRAVGVLRIVDVFQYVCDAVRAELG
ncbi:MAG: hypothetical protein EA406_09240 [Rhodospirillales bacterium]|nr:MAG: hypothetical protein EA406_09240 [Rhodospirillales bacterium]